MAINVAVRVKKRRDALRMAGLRPVQIWVPDTRRPGFDDECRRQSKLAAQSDRKDVEMMDSLEKILSDVEGWTI
ncbi:MAG: antitoxin MazE family protein [Leptospirales bacterium]